MVAQQVQELSGCQNMLVLAPEPTVLGLPQPAVACWRRAVNKIRAPKAGGKVHGTRYAVLSLFLPAFLGFWSIFFLRILLILPRPTYPLRNLYLTLEVLLFLFPFSSASLVSIPVFVLFLLLKMSPQTLTILAVGVLAAAPQVAAKILSCADMDCPIISRTTAATCTVADQTFNAVGVAGIDSSTDSLKGLSWVKGVGTYNINSTASEFDQTFYLGTPDGFDFGGTGACALLFTQVSDRVSLATPMLGRLRVSAAML